jgi:hypothetical protein
MVVKTLCTSKLAEDFNPASVSLAETPELAAMDRAARRHKMSRLRRLGVIGNVVFSIAPHIAP